MARSWDGRNATDTMRTQGRDGKPPKIVGRRAGWLGWTHETGTDGPGRQATEQRPPYPDLTLL